MKKRTFHRWYYHVRHRYLTTNNFVLFVALLVAASWAWGSIIAMQRNYGLQKEIDHKERLLTLAELEAQNQQYQQNYYNSDEYKELAAREKLGLVNPGEKVFILPPNSVEASATSVNQGRAEVPKEVEKSNLQQWLNFLFGGGASNLRR